MFLSLTDRFKEVRIMEEKHFQSRFNQFGLTIETKIIQFDFLQLLNKNDDIEAQFFIICFDKIIFEVNYNLLHLFTTFFENNLDCTFYFLHRSKEFFDKVINIKYQLSNEDPETLLQDIATFEKYFHSKEIPFLQPTVYGYLIHEGLYKLKSDRISNFFAYDSQFKKVLINEKDLIKIKYITGSNSSLISLYYDWRNEKFLIAKHAIVNNQFYNLFLREVNNYKEISHPFIPTFYETNDNQNLFAIDYIGGHLLQDIKELKLSEEQKIKIIFQLMIVIEYLHNLKFVYRDLKPNNVFIDHNNTVVLIDFDSMIRIDDKESDPKEFTKEFQSIFSATELGYGEVSFKSDVYSLGMMIYYIIKEKNPECDNHMFILDFDLKFSKLQEICEKCISKSPDRRPTLSFLIDYFYDNFFGPMQVHDLFNVKGERLMKLSESNTIHSIKNIHSNKYFKYWIYLSSYDTIESHKYFCSIYEKGEIVPHDSIKYIHYATIITDKLQQPSLQYQIGCMYMMNEEIPRDIPKAIHYLELSANQNYVDAFNTLGLIYLEEKYGFFDIKKATFFLQKAAEKNDFPAQKNLGILFFEYQDIPKAIHYLTLAAKQNDPESQCLLGQIYWNYKPNNNETDIKNAEYYFTLAANQNITLAQNFIGTFYLNGIYVAKDVRKAILYLTKAAEKKDPTALNSLGNLYYIGKDVNQNINKAIKYYTLASEQNYPIAQNTLGIIYLEGKHIKKDVNKAFYYFSLAAEKHYMYAQNNLAIIYIEYKKDISKAIHYFQLAANQGHKDAQFSLGNIYLEGEYVPFNLNKAIFYLKLASQPSNVMMRLYNIDHDIPTNPNDGIHKLYNKFIPNKNCEVQLKYGNNQAQLILACLYQHGIFVKKDIDQSILYYKDATLHNNQIAKNNLGVIKRFGKDKNLGLAKQYFTEGKNDVPSMFNLASLLFFEKDAGIDLKKSLELAVKSSNKGCRASNYLICLILLKLNIKIEQESIKAELDKYKNNSNDLPHIIYNIIKREKLEDADKYDILYHRFENFYYIYFIKRIVSSDLLDKAMKITHLHKTEKQEIPKINKLFYEGFGISI